MTLASLPTLDEYGYQPIRFLETDSKMSSILLASDSQQRLLILKIARVDQTVRADVNRQAIQNTVNWFAELGTHPGIAQLYPIHRNDTGTDSYLARLHEWQGAPEFLAMEYLEGGSLRELVGRKRLALEDALQITHGIARSLDFIHQRGCVHRDLKPENILFQSTPTLSAGDGSRSLPMQPLLIDFGVAARRGENRYVSGSRLWMAPELQLAYERFSLPVDPAWDIYALGLILCYMLSGLLPQRRNYDYASYQNYQQQALTILERDLNKRSDPGSNVGAQIKQLVQRALAKEPALRPSADEFAEAVAAILKSLGVALPTAHSAWSRIDWWRIGSSRELRIASLVGISPKHLLMTLLAILSLFVILSLWRNRESDALSSADPQATTVPQFTSAPQAEQSAASPTQLPLPPTLVESITSNAAPTLVPLSATIQPLAPTLLPNDP